MSGKKCIRDEEQRLFYTELGKYIAAQRMKLGISQKDLADILGITFQQVQKYEIAANRIPIFVLHKISQVYGVSFAEFIGGAIADKDSYRILDTESTKRLLTDMHERINELEKHLMV